MSKQLKTGIIKYAVTFAIALSLVAYYAFSRDIFTQELVMQYRILCDGFFLPGVFLIFFGLLFIMNNVGALDAISYLLKYAVRTFVPGAFSDMPRYLEYVEARREKRVKGFEFIFIVGAVLLAISVVFLILFYSVYQG